MGQYACLVINQIIANTLAVPFNCTPMDRASDSMLVYVLKENICTRSFSISVQLANGQFKSFS